MNEATKLFLHWIKERHNVYLNRQSGHKKPWTEDKILQEAFFTNPYRENDKVTKWVNKEIRQPFKECTPSAIIFAIGCFRWFNYIPTGVILNRYGLLRSWNTEKAVSALESISGQVFTGAFNISNSGSTKPKINRVCEDYVAPLWESSGRIAQAVRNLNTLQGTHSVLMRVPGLGGSGFMAAQIVCDLKYTKVLAKADDWWTWCSPGPGSRRGLNRILDKPIDSPVPKNWLEEINELRKIVNNKISVQNQWQTFHAQDIQNCLCEYDKYCRVLNNEGRSKRRYAGK